MLKKILNIFLLFMSLSAVSQTSIKTMFYNILMFPEEQSTFNRPVILKAILDEYQPDIFMVCELQSEEGANQILELSLNVDEDIYAAAPFTDNQSSGADLQQLVFYRKDKFTLASTSIIETEVRDINHYTLKLSTVNEATDPVLFEVFVTHLKSSQGGANVTQRLAMVNAFTSTLGSLDPNANVIFSGDLNIYTSTEPAYIELLDPTNDIVLKDPIDTPGAWNNNEDFEAVHTQSTRTSSGPFGTGAGGGMDDRFDFMLISENMMTNPKLRYVPETYDAYGNNGNCYNLSVNDPTCVGEFDSALRQNLWLMSDHLPVVMELETDQEIVILSGTDFDTTANQIQLENTFVDQTLRLKMSYVLEEPIEINVYNTIGQNMMSVQIDPSQNVSLNVSGLSSGVYYFTTNKTSQPIKFLKK